MPYIDFVNEDRFDEMDELTRSLFGEDIFDDEDEETEFYKDLLMEQQEQM